MQAGDADPRGAGEQRLQIDTAHSSPAPQSPAVGMAVWLQAPSAYPAVQAGGLAPAPTLLSRELVRPPVSPSHMTSLEVPKPKLRANSKSSTSPSEAETAFSGDNSDSNLLSPRLTVTSRNNSDGGSSQRNTVVEAEFFGLTVASIADILESRSLAYSGETLTVLDVLKRLRSNPDSGLCAARDLKPHSWFNVSLIEAPSRDVRNIKAFSSNEIVAVVVSSDNESPRPVLAGPMSEEPESDEKVLDGPLLHSLGEASTSDALEMKNLTIDKNFSSDPYRIRKQEFGDNTLPETKLKSLWSFALDVLKDRMLIILMIAAAADVAIGIYKSAFAEQKDPLGFVDGLVIILAVFVIVMISAVNDFRKQTQFHELSNFSNSLAKVQVIRDGANAHVKPTDLLVGDVCVLHAGDMIPADGLVIQGFNLTTDESSLTGESVALAKDTTTDPFLLSGTKLVGGVGRMVVIATGRNSAKGRLLAAIEGAEMEETPLQKKLSVLADLIAKFGTVTALLMFVGLVILYGVYHHDGSSGTVAIVNDVLNLFIVAVTLIVVAVPEGLPLAVTIALAHAALRMLKDNNLVRHLKACETMGNATTICSDKTGTLTQNRMEVAVGMIACRTFGMENLVATSADEENLRKRMLSADESLVIRPGGAFGPDCALPSVVLSHIARSVNLNSTAEEITTTHNAQSTPEFVGSKTEIALLEFTKQKLGRAFAVDRKSMNVVEVIPFSSERKRMSTIVTTPYLERDGKLETALFGAGHEMHSHWLFCKGAGELVVNLCNQYLAGDGMVSVMSDSIRAEFQSFIEQMASCALRTICLAVKPVAMGAPQIMVNGAPLSTLDDDSGLILVGIMGIRDPIRPEVPQAVADCTRAGVVVRMVTGDNVATARSIAKLTGILADRNVDEYAVMDGPTFRRLSPEMMDTVVPQLRVLARSSPQDKQILVNNLKRLGETVAVTGDGTNDAPAMKSADVGFSMGIAGTEMAKEASDIVLLDDNFASIAKAIIWGRSVYDSVQKFLQFQLTVNIVAVAMTVVSSVLTAVYSEERSPISVLTAVQLLWVNLIMDTFAALALATDPPTPDLLNRPPSRKSDALISYDMWKMIAAQSIYQTIVCLTVYVLKAPWVDGRLDVVVDGFPDTFTNSYTLMATCVFNSHREMNISKNPLFMGIVGGSVVVQIIIVQFGGSAFKTTWLGANDWLLCIGLAFISLPLGAAVKLLPDFFKK
ncbi:hypothetical protein HDU82_007683 [Entophlyctis luteolus]|nr:hypothetical protein HDU82_007683 [Entophlyctis luteolus]